MRIAISLGFRCRDYGSIHITVAVYQRCNVFTSDYHTSTYVTVSRRIVGRSSGLRTEPVSPESISVPDIPRNDYIRPALITAAGLICEAIGHWTAATCILHLVWD
jgi:hypothetical protein